ncbi:MAG: HAD family phosphatase [Proteobacteria bacterium]|nr:HAD family phosphatase [Pseudomonadota bacterium]
MVRQTVIFDLGGVLVSVDFMRACERLQAAGGDAAARIRGTILDGREKSDFDSGRLNPREFAQRLCAMLHIDLPYAEFAEIWCDIFAEQREVTALLDEIGKRADLILLSNTDPLHLDRVRRQFGFLDKFGQLVLSYEVGHTKPAREIYQRALGLCVPGSRVVFFDDVAEFVAAARACGLPAEQFVGVEKLRRDLTRFGVM